MNAEAVNISNPVNKFAIGLTVQRINESGCLKWFVGLYVVCAHEMVNYRCIQVCYSVAHKTLYGPCMGSKCEGLMFIANLSF